MKNHRERARVLRMARSYEKARREAVNSIKDYYELCSPVGQSVEQTRREVDEIIAKVKVAPVPKLFTKCKPN